MYKSSTGGFVVKVLNDKDARKKNSETARNLKGKAGKLAGRERF
jgi:hypothetical protein